MKWGLRGAQDPLIPRPISVCPVFLPEPPLPVEPELLQNVILVGLCCSRPPHLAELLAYTLLGVSSSHSRGPSSSPKRWQLQSERGLPSGGFPYTSVGENLPATQETLVRFLDQEDPLEKGMATHSSILAWEIPRRENPGGLQFMGLQREMT